MDKHFSLPKDGGLLIDKLPAGILHADDKIYTDVFPEQSEASELISEMVISSIKEFEALNPGKLFKLGLTTGATPVSLYKKLSRKYKEGKVSFRNVEVFSIDEYYPSSNTASQSRNARIHNELLNNIDILPENIHIPDGTVSGDRLRDYCAEFDAMARDIDLLVIGVGEEGQVGFNESGASEQSCTRTVLLSYSSRKRQSRNFHGEMSQTPRTALTMGMGTMLSAKQVILMAWGEDKAEVVRRIVEGECSTDCPASLFQHHPKVRMFVDETAGSLLTREVAPWLIGPCEWTPKFRRKAVLWLCQKVGKPILKLSEQDYLQNNLEELLDQFGPYSKINIDIFNDLQHTITGWPGGKPNADDSTRPVASTPFPKKVLIFSPHPDDDVISMGGTFIRLVHQGHNVHVAYQTSGDVAVHDDVVIQHMDAAAQLGFDDRFDEVKALVASKVPGNAEPRQLLDYKAAIRRSEARGAVRSFGLDESHVHFLNLPFYESGGVAKLPRTQVDVDIIKKLMNELAPDQIYMAGDLADPHGTHRVCTEAALEALGQLREEGASWTDNCHVWLYRGAWMEWELGRVDMAVPLSPEEVVEKRHAIYHHLSQKDIVPFPGDDPREFWQRAEERTQNTARLYNELGMAEYQAIEVFLRLF
ncbi:MAG: PIG-L family deacetylase [Bacteroidales bacterium]|nr:PIG-L family deacetylase [Bacteroidales bacterium]MDY3783710.1 PIG-L family deacetylase [Candidatus Cryptobacteroides sp.]